MEDTMEEENGREAKLKAEITRWLIFFGVAIMLSVMTWLGWSLTNRKNPITSFTTLVSDSSVAIGIQGSAPESLDIRTEQGTALEQALLENVYETLVSRSETNKLQPSIAKSWQISDDGLTYTFTLNSNMTFANGHKLDSSDVVWSLQNAVNNHYVGADQLGDLKEITNPNANTVVITLAKPNPRLLRALAGRAGVVYDAESKTNYAKSAVGSGPFTVSTADQSQIALQRNDSYWGKKAASSQVTLYYYANEESMADAMKAGKISMALPLSASTASELGKTNGITADSGISFDKVMLAFNNDNNSPFSDEQIRKMTRYAIDAKTIAKNALGVAHLAEHAAVRAGDAFDGQQRTVRVHVQVHARHAGLVHVLRGDLAVGLELGEHIVGGHEAALAVGDGDGVHVAHLGLRQPRGEVRSYAGAH